VLFAHDTTLALVLAADLVNGDGLSGPAAMDAFLDAHDIVPHPPASSADVRAVRLLRPRLRAIWDTTDVRRVAAMLNDLLSESNARPWLTDHDPAYGWHLHVTSAGASLEHRIAALAAFAFADLVRMGDTSRLRHCAVPDCDAVLIDLSKNRSRIYCDTGNCGNRQHVAAYRARKSGPSEPLPGGKPP
jgi:predicted RNA-binding Zn ribbon-like protein